MEENNPVVTINLDRVRELRFGHKAMKRWSAYTGKSISSMDTDIFTPDEIEPLLFFMLEKDAEDHGEKLEMDQMEDLLDLIPPGVLYKNLSLAISAAFPDSTGAEKNGAVAAGTGGKA